MSSFMFPQATSYQSDYELAWSSAGWGSDLPDDGFLKADQPDAADQRAEHEDFMNHSDNVQSFGNNDFTGSPNELDFLPSAPLPSSAWPVHDDKVKVPFDPFGSFDLHFPEEMAYCDQRRSPAPEFSADGLEPLAPPLRGVSSLSGRDVPLSPLPASPCAAPVSPVPSAVPSLSLLPLAPTPEPVTEQPTLQTSSDNCEDNRMDTDEANGDDDSDAREDTLVTDTHYGFTKKGVPRRKPGRKSKAEKAALPPRMPPRGVHYPEPYLMAFIKRFAEKRRLLRNNPLASSFKYEVRRDFAVRRPRVGGRFVSKDAIQDE